MHHESMHVNIVGASAIKGLSALQLQELPSNLLSQAMQHHQLLQDHVTSSGGHVQEANCSCVSYHSFSVDALRAESQHWSHVFALLGSCSFLHLFFLCDHGL